MKKLLILAIIAAMPCAACTDCPKGCTHTPTPINDPVRRIGDMAMADFHGTVEKSLTRDQYQFIDASGRILASVDGDLWRATKITDQDGIMIIG